MDVPLRCNNHLGGYCRKELSKEAVTTSCNHIFCKECFEQLDFQSTPTEKRKCPACRANLPHIDDIHVVNLRPSEEYKSSILAGLDPPTILECTLRGVSFWTYQMNAEISWQNHLVHAMTDKYSALNTSATQAINEAKNDVTLLESKVRDLKIEKEQANKQIQNYAQMCEDKNKRYQTYKTLYEGLKKKVQDEQFQSLAAVTARDTLRSMGVISKPEVSSVSSQKYFLNTHPEKRESEDLLTHMDAYESDQFHMRSLNGGGPRAHTSSDAGIMPPPLRPSEREQTRRLITNSTPAQRGASNRLNDEYHSLQHSMRRPFGSESMKRGPIDQSPLAQNRHGLQSPHFRQFSQGLSPQIHRGIKSSKPLVLIGHV